MENIQKLQKAKSFLEMLARGIDPVSGNLIGEDSVLNKVQVQDCFLYIAKILEKAICEGGEIPQAEKAKFNVTPEQKQSIIISEKPISMIKFIDNINKTVDLTVSKRLTTLKVTNWLTRNGVIAVKEKEIVKIERIKVLTDKAAEIGIQMTESVSKNTGEIKQIIVLSDTAQKFIIDNIDSIASSNRADRNTL